MRNVRMKNIILFNLIGLILFSLIGCGDVNYETFEECQLKESGKISRSGKELSSDAIRVVTDYCIRYPEQSEIEDGKNKKAENIYTPKIISDPNWKPVGKQSDYSDGTRYLIDDSNVELNGSRRVFWLREFSKSQDIDGNTFKVRRVETDCSAGTIATLTYYEIKNGERDGDSSGPFPSQIVSPGTNGSEIYRYVCAKK
jgi:hypothetical protein